jgi:hypothetical protein
MFDKPVDVDRLLVRIGDALRKRQSQRAYA